MHHAIHIVPIGPGDPGLLTLQAADTLRTARHLILRTGRHPVAEWLTGQGIAFTTLDHFYDEYEDFDEMHAAMAQELWQRAEKHVLTFAVMDATTDGAVAALALSCPEGGKLKCLPGISAADVCLAALPGQRKQEGLRVIPASELTEAQPDPTEPLFITEIDNRTLAGEVKLWLGELYDDETLIVFFPVSEKTNRKSQPIELMALDRQTHYDHTVCALIPAVDYEHRSRSNVADLQAVMQRLRAPGGCPWDHEQTHESLRRYLIEEAYEVAQAIDDDNPDHLADELGDVLLQVVFHCSIAMDYSEFNLNDVATAIVRKMIHRHPHVFAGGPAGNWEQLKMVENGQKTGAEVLQAVPLAMPALMRADKVQKKARQFGFDWDKALDALYKIPEEAEEVRIELEKGGDPAALIEELGDLLFACVNVVRLCGVEPEFALNKATEKFVRRFTAMEKRIVSEGKTLKDLTLSEMDVYWSMVKSAEHEAAL